MSGIWVVKKHWTKEMYFISLSFRPTISEENSWSKRQRSELFLLPVFLRHPNPTHNNQSAALLKKNSSRLQVQGLDA